MDDDPTCLPSEVTIFIFNFTFSSLIHIVKNLLTVFVWKIPCEVMPSRAVAGKSWNVFLMTTACELMELADMHLNNIHRKQSLGSATTSTFCFSPKLRWNRMDEKKPTYWLTDNHSARPWRTNNEWAQFHFQLSQWHKKTQKKICPTFGNYHERPRSRTKDGLDC